MKFKEFSPEQKRMYDLRHYPVRPHVGVGGVIIGNKKLLSSKKNINFPLENR